MKEQLGALTTALLNIEKFKKDTSTKINEEKKVT
jgi:hypothetical protein